MASITVTTTPQSVGAVLGLGLGPGGVAVTRSQIWVGECQNADGTENVYRLVSVATPTGKETAFRHPPGDRWAMSVHSDDIGATWLWTSNGTAVVVMSDGLPGV